MSRGQDWNPSYGSSHRAADTSSLRGQPSPPSQPELEGAVELKRSLSWECMRQTDGVCNGESCTGWGWLFSLCFSVPQPSPKPVWIGRKGFPHCWREKINLFLTGPPGSANNVPGAAQSPELPRAGFLGLGGVLGEHGSRKFLDL